MEEAERLCDRVAIIEHGRIIDIDSPERLVDRHCPERTVVLDARTRRWQSVFERSRELSR
jgi:ABC-2 type transport system ATP-binding protein